LGAREP